MSKGLEALKKVNQYWADVNVLGKSNIVLTNFEWELIEKELKALEIIKKRECLFKGLSETTQEEFELLKEVLKDESDID